MTTQLDTQQLIGGGLLFVLTILAIIGMGQVLDTLGQWLRPTAKPKAKPKPKLWKVNFHQHDGFPWRGYSLDDRQVAKVMAMIHHELDHGTEDRSD